ncbi:MAG TPA: squalene/phytoene synthase family protein [Anaerolineales bacterium]|nr:squalene/phytoene synthase family protein [Anaerolineales bacterium]
MSNTTASLARRITWASSKQSYLTAQLLADQDLVDDCLRAYAYFRWADDRIDLEFKDSAESFAFILRQKTLIEQLYRGQRPGDLCPEEAMLADLIAHDRKPESGLRSFIRNFMTVIEFDAIRRGRLASRSELAEYTSNLATAVMDGIQYFIGNGESYPKTSDRNLAVTGAHITHMLRDVREDLPVGIINVPAEALCDQDIRPLDLDSERFRAWVREQVELARTCFREGKAYIDSLDVLRCKLAGVFYCARFECILDAIERDGYRLRADYPERHCLKVWLGMLRLALLVIGKHLAERLRSPWLRPGPQAALASGMNIPSYHTK